MTLQKNEITLADRLAFGFLTIDELCILKGCGRTAVYADIAAGRLQVVKHGRRTRVAGPVALAYEPGARRNLDDRAA